MGKRVVVESARDRRALVEDAGWKRLSPASLLAGVLVAYGAFAVLAGIAGGILEAVDADTDIGARWDDLGVAAGLVVAGLLFLSYLFGGYVAGRMARRAGSLHGAGTFVLGVLVAAGVAVLVRQAAGSDAVVENLRDLGLPTTGDEWRDVGTVAGLTSLGGMLVGALLGGILGERWHAKLLSRAVDPDVGAEADARRVAAEAAAEARKRHTTAGARAERASLLRRRRAEDGTAAVAEPADTRTPAVADTGTASPADTRPTSPADTRTASPAETSRVKRDRTRVDGPDERRRAGWPDDGTGAPTRAGARPPGRPAVGDDAGGGADGQGLPR